MTDNSRSRILVTGGRGFIGAALVAALGKAGYAAQAGVRNPAAPREIASDLDNAAQIGAAVANTDMVVHAAYGDPGAMERQCAGLLAAMSAAKTQNLIYFSSIAIYGARENFVRENDGAVGTLDAYAAGKTACERLVRVWAENAAHPERRAIILRPGIVYGAGSRYWIERLSQRINAGVWGDFGAAGEGLAALIHVDDLASLVLAAVKGLSGEARKNFSPVETFNAVGPETPSWNAYFSALAAELGAPALAPLDAARLARRAPVALAAKVWRRVGLPGFEKQALIPAAGELALFSRKATYDTAAARNTLGFAPSISVAQGLRRSGLQAKR
ncbi:MAG: NAD-dependent epimerase/dehydratase family protein [Rhodoblastus sp.]